MHIAMSIKFAYVFFEQLNVYSASSYVRIVVLLRSFTQLSQALHLQNNMHGKLALLQPYCDVLHQLLTPSLQLHLINARTLSGARGMQSGTVGSSNDFEGSCLKYP